MTISKYFNSMREQSMERQSENMKYRFVDNFFRTNLRRKGFHTLKNYGQYKQFKAQNKFKAVEYRTLRGLNMCFTMLKFYSEAKREKKLKEKREKEEADEKARQAKMEREEEKIVREGNGFYVEAEQLHACEAALMEMQAKHEGVVEAHTLTKAALEEKTTANQRAEDDLQLTRERLESMQAQASQLAAALEHAVLKYLCFQVNNKLGLADGVADVRAPGCRSD